MQDKFLFFLLLVVMMEVVGRNKAWHILGASKGHKSVFIMFMIAYYVGAFMLVNERLYGLNF